LNYSPAGGPYTIELMDQVRVIKEVIGPDFLRKLLLVLYFVQKKPKKIANSKKIKILLVRKRIFVYYYIWYLIGIAVW
jgi:hypothetical protein